MKKVRGSFAFLLGLLSSIVVSLLFSLLTYIYGMMRFNIPLISSMPNPFMAPVILFIVSSHLVECICGAMVAGFFSKERGAVLGVVVAYFYLFIVTVNTLVGSMSEPYLTFFRATKIYTGYDVIMQSFLYGSAVFGGLLGGALGVLASRARNKVSSTPTSPST